MDEHFPFLQTILAHPDEDTPRLVYADWLEEQGQMDRAEFVRVQCSRARLPLRDPVRKELAQRERELLFRHATAWRAGLPPLAHLVWRFWERGCMAAVQVNHVGALCLQADEIFAAAPVQTLIFWRIDDEAAGSLAQEPFLQRIRRFIVRGGDLTWRGLKLLSESNYLGGLKELRLEHQRLGDAAIDVLSSSPILTGLEQLCLIGNGITDHGLKTVLASPHLRSLTVLDLSYNRITAEGLESLAERETSGQFNLLDLRGNILNDLNPSRFAGIKQRLGDSLLVDVYIPVGTLAGPCSYDRRAL